MEMISTDGNWHTETIASYKVKPSDQLKFIIKDCQEALVAMPDSPKAGQYMDCIHYAAMELNERLSDDLPHQELVYSDELEMNTCETCQAVHQALRQLGKI